MSKKTKAQLEAELAALQAQLAGKSTPPRAPAAPRSAPRPRNAALAKSAPTVRMQVNERELEPRRPGSADILAVALVVFIAALALLGDRFDPRHKAPTSLQHIPLVSIAVRS